MRGWRDQLVAMGPLHLRQEGRAIPRRVQGTVVQRSS